MDSVSFASFIQEVTIFPRSTHFSFLFLGGGGKSSYFCGDISLLHWLERKEESLSEELKNYFRFIS